MTVRPLGLGIWGLGFAASAALAVALTGCNSGPSAPEDTRTYQQRVEQKRAEKEAFFRDLNDAENPMRPLTQAKRDELLPLSYYPVDPDSSVPAGLKVADEQPVFEMPTSTGKMRKMRRVGVLEFMLKGQPLTLGAFVEDGADLNRLFVPFSDLTTGKETYAAGRYMDLDRTATGVYVVDFNDAYNPYCAYNATYDCPFPPPSNRLKVPVEAGERVKSQADAPAVTPQG
jgi:uncharacterized protein (DUF1684 family)